MTGWCGYIDMLGTRALAQRSPQDLLEGLDKFHTAIDDSFDHFTNGKCIAFSDGAFLIAKDFDSFIPFYRRVRNQLFQAGTFFRCSFIKGDIHIIRRGKPQATIKTGDLPDFFSLTFGKDAPEAYQKESELKGIGCVIKDAPDKRQLRHVVPSFFLKRDANRLQARSFRDVRYSEFETSDDGDDIARSFDHEHRILDRLISSCHATLTQSNTTGSYYLSPLVSMVRSTRLAEANFNDKTGFVAAPYIFRELMSDGLIKAIRELPGLNMLLLACFDHLYAEKKGVIPAALEQRVIAKMSRIPGCFKNLDGIPDFVITSAAKHRLIELKVVLARTNKFSDKGRASHASATKTSQQPQTQNASPVLKRRPGKV